MGWFLLLVSFSLAVFMGAASASLFAMLRPGWSEHRLLLVSAGLLPSIVLIATVMVILALIFGGSVQGGDMRDLAVAAVARIGGLVALLALLGSLVGAALRQLGTRR